MSNDVIPELKNLLSQATLGHPYDPSSVQREKFLIEHLSEQVRQWETGEMTYEELTNTFAEHDLGTFDLDLWIQSKADEGVYFSPFEDNE